MSAGRFLVRDLLERLDASLAGAGDSDDPSVRSAHFHMAASLIDGLRATLDDMVIVGPMPLHEFSFRTIPSSIAEDLLRMEVPHRSQAFADAQRDARGRVQVMLTVLPRYDFIPLPRWRVA